RLLLRRRRELHARVAEELERRHPDRLTDLSKILSHHYLLGERWIQGARHALVAARQAVMLYALTDALDTFEATLDALARVGGVRTSSVASSAEGQVPTPARPHDDSSATVVD